MPRKGKRVPVATNIYKDGTGFEVVARVEGWPKSQRFPKGTPLRVMKAWQEDTQARLRGSGVKIVTRGSLAADVDLYLTMVRHLAGWVSLRAELRAWVQLFGKRRRGSLDSADALHARQTWLAAGKSIKTVKNREAALSRLWHLLDGRRSVSPVDELPPLRPPKTPIRRIRPEEVIAVYETLIQWRKDGRLHDSKTIGRFMVYATCGRRPSEIMRAKFDDIDLVRGIWTPRNGKGGTTNGIYLNDDMLKAWGVFIGAQAWGYFKGFQRTIGHAGWPTGVRPYNLRHNVGMSMSEAGVDLADIAPHLGHLRLETARKHYVPVLGSRLQDASERIAGRFGW